MALEDFSWDDSSATVGTSIFPNVTISAGESIIVVNEPNPNLMGFKEAWNLGVGIQVVGSDAFAGTAPFSALSGTSGDEIHLYDEDEMEIATVTLGSATLGSSFEWTSNGENLELSVAGENGAYTAPSDGAGGDGLDVGSPGVSVAHPVPEPSSLVLIACGLLSLVVTTHRS